MPVRNDPILSVHAYALQLRSRRGELLGSNLANADTPNYKARDIDFKAAMNAAQSVAGTKMISTRAGHIQPQGTTTGAPVLYRTPNQASLDGNTVDTQVEQNRFAENAVRYRASLRFISGRIQGLMAAIKGE